MEELFFLNKFRIELEMEIEITIIEVTFTLQWS